MERAVAIATLMLAAAGLMPTSASAQTFNSEQAAPAQPAGKAAKPTAKSSSGYFIEFRAARIGIYGHSYVAYGRLDRFGNPETTTYADRHPMGNYAIMALGHFVPVPANTEWDPEVLDLPIAHKYRVKLNDSQYNNLLAAVKRANSATLARCLDRLFQNQDWLRISINRYFYVYQAPRPLAEIEKDIATIEGQILDMLKQVA